MWELFMILLVVAIAWKLYMMTFRPEDYKRLVEADDERKARRNQQAMSVAKEVVGWWFKK